MQNFDSFTFVILMLLFSGFISWQIRLLNSNRISEKAFLEIIQNNPNTTVIQKKGGLFSNNNRYFTSHHGLYLYTTTYNDLHLPSETLIIKPEKYHN
jgi:hypothetical protein